jgi:hypothetical protein
VDVVIVSSNVLRLRDSRFFIFFDDMDFLVALSSMSHWMTAFLRSVFIFRFFCLAFFCCIVYYIYFLFVFFCAVFQFF